MSKASKHAQIPSAMPQKNVINSIMSFLPDNRPITSLQIVEDFEKCPKNFTTVHRTYDQDSDADLWRENSIIFGRQTARYLCLSKTEGLPEYVVETLRVISEKELPPKEFSLLSRTADTEQRAWRKRQIAYKLSKRSSVTHAVTDIILCSKLKTAPEGFKLAGDINGILVCYKTGVLYIRVPPGIPQQQIESNINSSEVEKALNRLNLNRRSNQPLPPVPQPNDNDYEEIQASYQISPMRPAPKPPANAAAGSSAYSIGTLGVYSELEGVPFSLHSNLKTNIELPSLPIISSSVCDLEYDFQLERQILCTMKSSASKNPFFQ
ncbi:multivesicular body subunit 12A [Episyrphus balteatus]|uniref:multivesicular body subunit 12A n=1 Tax=Episyrphus balteatus TaxID=286459 RepID=UPI0024852076|nr:multivesicular body subunit 12A [Episyrphus balteatus]XP_055841603.1 multivesicular body subunit 12A [Episyrphus balteatus]